MSWSNEQTLMLIQEYKKYPSLFFVKHKDYHNKHKRNQNMQMVVMSLKAIRPATTETEVQKKFLGLRSTYAAERKKVLNSMHSGVGEEDVHKPGLWYYDQMEFLNEHLVMRISTSNVEVAHLEPNVELTQDDVPQFQATDDADQSSIIDRDMMTPDSYRAYTPSRSPTPGTSTGTKRKRREKQDNADDVIMNTITEGITKISSIYQTPVKIQSDDEAYGEYVGRRLSKLQDIDIKMEVRHQIDILLYDAFKEDRQLNK